MIQIRSSKFEVYQAARTGGVYWITGAVNVVVGRWYHGLSNDEVFRFICKRYKRGTNSTYASTQKNLNKR